jgi:hypothetical protein
LLQAGTKDDLSGHLSSLQFIGNYRLLMFKWVLVFTHTLVSTFSGRCSLICHQDWLGPVLGLQLKIKILRLF